MADVMMELNGARRRVPEERVAYFAAKGATVVQEAPAHDEGAEVEPAHAVEEPDDGRSAYDKADRAVTAGLQRWTTLGYDDELAGAAARLGDLIQRQRDSDAGMLSGGGESLAESWRQSAAAQDQARAERRAETRAAEAGAPGAYKAGSAVGGVTSALATPAMRGASALKRVLGGAALGGASNIGLADEEATAGNTLASAALGGGLVAAAPVLGRAAGKVLDKGVGLAGRVLKRLGANADKLRVLTTMGATGGSIANPRVLEELKLVPGGEEAAAKILRDTGISRGITTTSGILKRAEPVLEKSGADIGRMIDEATTAGGFVDTQALQARLRVAAAEASGGLLSASDQAAGKARELNALADAIAEARPASATPAEVKALSVKLGEDASSAYRRLQRGNEISGKMEATTEGRRAAEDAIKQTMADLGQDPAAYQAAKTTNQVARIARDAAEANLGRAGKNNLFGLSDLAAVQAGSAATGSGAGGAVLGAARKALSPLSSSARATAAETARAAGERMTRLPAAGPVLRRIGEAGGRGSVLVPKAVQSFGAPDEDAALAQSLQRRGLTNTQIADILGVTADDVALLLGG